MLIVERCFIENIHQTSTFSVFMIFWSKSYFLWWLYTQLALDYIDFDSRVRISFRRTTFFFFRKTFKFWKVSKPNSHRARKGMYDPLILLDVREVIEKYGFSLWSFPETWEILHIFRQTQMNYSKTNSRHTYSRDLQISKWQERRIIVLSGSRKLLLSIW